MSLRHPLTTRDRRLARAASPWVRSFACEDVRALIVCRGPIRREALDVFAEMGLARFGILVSDKDSIVYTHALAPELRLLGAEQIHHVRDYSGASKEERVQRTAEIVAIARANGYTHVFAGYGFMAEDGDFVRALEDAGLVFIGPASTVQFAAGLKDEAKRTALEADVSVTPGVDDATRRVIMRKHPGISAAEADRLLAAAYAERRDIYTIDELGAELAAAAAELFAQYHGRRLRLKAIGGGGGKGQRILSEGADVPALAREILGEVKTGGVGDNKNILLEMNIEETRHNEIQLIGNGHWCLALGGRDCSLQMHEQKLLEISLTREGLDEAIAQAELAGDTVRLASLAADHASLSRMEAEAERFGQAVGLNSASTFECIVEGDHHYFMEVNTRIQVEHRVTELCYRLVFQNPDDPSDSFEVTSLIECMVLLARHGPRLPRPQRLPRERHAVEARLNATNGALEPHAGGLVLSWSDPDRHEIRDDQGICVRNPDTGSFMRYRVAGAYDSNIALLLTTGATREELYARLIDLLRRTHIRGIDLHTNVAFHLGLAQWFAARDVWAKPTTRFVGAYLAQVGRLAETAADLDPALLWSECGRGLERALPALGLPESALGALRKTLTAKDTLIRRPVERLLDEPHLLSAFLSRTLPHVVVGDGVTWRRNPLESLADAYWLLDLEPRADAPAAEVIWDHDEAILERGLGFYRSLAARLGDSCDWPATVQRLADPAPPDGFAPSEWQAVRGAHVGFQAGLELLTVLVQVGLDSGFYALRVRPDGTLEVPPELFDKALQERMRKVLAPPPIAHGNEIVAISGGMFYGQESPDRPPFVVQGSHFAAGDPLYLIEVMKMFNRVLAPFAGTVDALLVPGGDGTIVHKGQPLFRVTPDEPIVVADPAAVAARRKSRTVAMVARAHTAPAGGTWFPGR